MCQVSQLKEDSAGLMQEVFSDEIRNARNEKLSPVSRGTVATKGTRKKSIVRVAVDYFATVLVGTQIRRKDEVQRCPICGSITVWRGYPTGHSRSHPAGSKGDYV